MVKLLDLIFFERIVSIASYLELFKDYLSEYLENISLYYPLEMLVQEQEDDAPAHFHHTVKAVLDEL